MKNTKLMIAVAAATAILAGCDTTATGVINTAETDAQPSQSQEGVQLELSGDPAILANVRSIIAKSTADGKYAYEKLPKGSYTITPSLEGFQFRPEKRDFIATNNDVSGLNFTSYEHQLWFLDSDDDGFGDSKSIVDAETQPNGYVDNDTDCEDEDPSINPSQPDLPDDNIDQNCDGTLASKWYRDSDQDSFGDINNVILAETAPEGYVKDNTDCDDLSELTYPGATEDPEDDIDQNCDGLPDRNWYADADEDGFGAMTKPIVASVQPDGYVESNTDCNDNAADINPAAAEIINDNIDQNCDLEKPRNYYLDADNDGYGVADSFVVASSLPAGYSLYDTDCDDTDDSVYPSATEVLGDGIDQNCDGTPNIAWFIDSDTDTYGDDSTEAILSEIAPGANYVDMAGDCDDSNNTIFPGAPETANDGIDQNCNNSDQTTFFADNDKDTFGDPNNFINAETLTAPAGFSDDNTDCDDTNAEINPNGLEIAADNIDQDCDGSDSFIWFVDGDADGFGSTNATMDSPTQPEGYSANGLDCDDASETVNPIATEIAGDGIDQNCNDYDKTNRYQDTDGDTFGSAFVFAYDGPALSGQSFNSDDCNDLNASIRPDAEEVPGNDVDENCDGTKE